MLPMFVQLCPYGRQAEKLETYRKQEAHIKNIETSYQYRHTEPRDGGKQSVVGSSIATAIGIFGLRGHQRVCLGVEYILEECQSSASSHRTSELMWLTIIKVNMIRIVKREISAIEEVTELYHHPATEIPRTGISASPQTRSSPFH